MKTKSIYESMIMQNDIYAGRKTLENNIQEYKVFQLADVILRDWKNVYFGARPYLEAMRSIMDLDEMYGADSARSIISYFLANASQWQGETARRVKAELRRRLK